MNEEHLGTLLEAMLKLSRGFRDVAGLIMEQEAEIGTIKAILEREGLAPKELNRAGDHVAELKEGRCCAISKRKCLHLSRQRSAGPGPIG